MWKVKVNYKTLQLIHYHMCCMSCSVFVLPLYLAKKLVQTVNFQY